METSKVDYSALAGGFFGIESFEDLVYVGKENLSALLEFWNTQEKMLAVRSNALYREFEDVRRETRDRERAELANEARHLLNKKKREIDSYKRLIWNAARHADSKPFVPGLRPFTYLKVGDEVVLRQKDEEAFRPGRPCGLYPAYNFSRSFIVDDRKMELTLDMSVSVMVNWMWFPMTSPDLFLRKEYEYLMENQDFLAFLMKGAR